MGGISFQSLLCKADTPADSTCHKAAKGLDGFLVVVLFLFLLHWVGSMGVKIYKDGFKAVFQKDGMSDAWRMLTGGAATPHLMRRSDTGADTTPFMTKERPTYEEAIRQQKASAAVSAQPQGEGMIDRSNLDDQTLLDQ